MTDSKKLKAIIAERGYELRNVAERMGNILVVEDIEKLEEMITDYDEITKGMKNESGSHNLEFNREFEEIVNNL